MSIPNSTSAYQNKRVTVMGLGLYKQGTGIEAVKFFLRQEAVVTVTDLRSAKELESTVKELVRYYGRLPKHVIASVAKQSFSNMKRLPRALRALAMTKKKDAVKRLTFILGKHQEEDFKNTDLVFQNPSVPADSPYLRLAAKCKIPIVNDWSIFLSQHTPKIFIGVTGTRGKSTTTALIYEMMKRHYKKVFLAGNLGVSPLSFIDTYKGEPIVAELSSWLLHHFSTVKKSPNVAVVTNIMNDHMDKYRSMRAYIEDKENVFRFQGAKDWLVLNYDNPITRSMAKKARGKALWFSVEKRLPRWVPLEDLQILGEHNRANALVAAVAAEAAGVGRRDIVQVLKTFRGLPNRLELIRTVAGIKYYNDTTATTPDATIAGLKVLGVRASKRIVLICGGADKRLDYRELGKYIKQRCKAVVLLKGSATPKIESVIKNKELGIMHAVNMRQAVREAQALAQNGDIVLLSPAAASFGLFKNEFDRGRQFVDAVRKL